MRNCGCHSHNGLLLSPEGLAQRRGSFYGNVDMTLPLRYVDKVGSVSGLELERDFLVFHEEVIDQQYQRFLNGS